MFEEAKALKVTMAKRKMSQGEMAKSLGVSQSYISNKLRLLSIEEKMQRQILENHLSERHARALLRLKSNDLMQRTLDRICNDKLSVEKSESLIDLILISNVRNDKIEGKYPEHISTFLDLIKTEIDDFCLKGGSATRNISHKTDKIYISICIDKNG